jgi:hypothetical protein
VASAPRGATSVTPKPARARALGKHAVPTQLGNARASMMGIRIEIRFARLTTALC